MDEKLETAVSTVSLIVGRVAFGAMVGVALALTLVSESGGYLYEEEVREAVAYPLLIGPLLAIIVLAIAPGRRAVIIGAVLFLMGCLLTKSEISAFPILAFLLGLLLAQFGWWQTISNSGKKDASRFDAIFVVIGALPGFILTSTLSGIAIPVVIALLTASSAVFASRGHHYQASSLEKAINQMSGSVRLLLKDRWSWRLAAFFVVYGLTLVSLVYFILDSLDDMSVDFLWVYFAPIWAALFVSTFPVVGRLAMRFSCSVSLGVVSIAGAILIFVADSLLGAWFSEVVCPPVLAFLLAASWRRLVAEFAIPLPKPMQYLAEPYVLFFAGVGGSLFFLPAVEVADTIDESVGLIAPYWIDLSPTSLLFVATAILAFTIGLPDRARSEEFVETNPIPANAWYFPGQNPMVQLPRGSDTCVVTIAYCVLEENRAAFEKLLREVGKIRRRAGAIGWLATVDPTDDRLWREHFMVDSWAEYSDAVKRETPQDRALKQELFNLNDWESLPMEEHLPIRVS